jgi:hypothetical protein
MSMKSCLPVAILLLAPPLAFGQIAPSIPGGGGGRMGYSSGAGIARPSGVPLAQPSFNPAPAGTPGSTVGYVSGAYVSGAYAPNTTAYKPIDGSYTGGFKPAASSPINIAAPTYSAPADVGANSYTPTSFSSLPPLGAPPSLLMPAPQSLPFTIAATPPGSGSTNADTQVKPSDITAPKDETYTRALARFNEGQYTDALAQLETPGRDKSAPLPTRKLYVAALVADGQYSMAAYQALEIAHQYPLAFLAEPTLASTYNKNPVLDLHHKAVTDYAQGNNGEMDTSVLLALYNSLANQPADAAAALAHANVPDADKDWFAKLQSTLKPKK